MKTTAHGATAVKAFLRIEELWDTIGAPANGHLCTDKAKKMKAHSKIVLSIEPALYPHVENETSPKAAWENLQKTYDDKGSTRKVNPLIEVSTTRLENCKSMDEYITRIISANQKLSNIGTKLPDDLVGALMLAGLPQHYKPMVMALSSSGKDISADLVKTKLLEEAVPANGSENFETRGLYAQARPTHSHPRRWHDQSQSRKDGRPRPRSSNEQMSQSQIRCYNCNRFGHLSNQYTAPRRHTVNACTSASTAADQESAEDSEPDGTVCALFSITDSETLYDAVLSPSLADTANAAVSSLSTDADQNNLNSNQPAWLVTVNNATSGNGCEWILDSGASMHMCADQEHLTNMRKPKTANNAKSQ